MKRNIFGQIGLAALTVATLFGVTACTDDMGWGGTPDLGEKVHGSLTIPLNVPSAATVSRSVDFSSSATLKIDNYWVGVYDTQTRELLGTSYDSIPRKDDGSRYTFNGISSIFTVENVEIDYYDKHPEVYVVGVVNFGDYQNNRLVKAKKAGSTDEYEPLLDLLKNAKTWDDFCNISIDAQSANIANPNESDGVAKMPIMMGYYTTSVSAAHPAVKGWDSNNVTQGNMRVGIQEVGGDVTLQEGNIRLMRLLSQVTVKVGGPEMMNSMPGFPGENIPSDLVKITNLQYKVVNNPTSVYLAEHATDTRGYNINSDLAVYAPRSANSADYDGENGFTEDGWISVNGTSFTYQKYENKHWGNVDWAKESSSPPVVGSMTEPFHFVREKRMDENQDLFRTLCLDKNHPFNNNASYFIIRADVEFNYNESGPFGDVKSGTIEYMIHEGATSNSDGTALTMTSDNLENMLCDYQRARNTIYTYNIGIMGLDNIMYEVMANLMGYEDYPHNDGISGSANSDGGIMPLPGEGTRGLATGISIPSFMDDIKFTYGIDSEYANLLYSARKDLKWRYLVNDLNGEKNYGNWTAEDNKYPGIPSPKSSVSSNVPSDILNSLEFYAVQYWDIYSTPPDGNNFPPEIKQDDFTWILLSPPSSYPGPGYRTPFPAKIIRKWTIEELINSNEELVFNDFNLSYGPSGPSGPSADDYMLCVYVPKLEAGPDVPFVRLDDVFRNFYFKLPFYDSDRCSSINQYFGFEQTPMDNRKELTGVRPSLQVTDHYYYTRYPTYWTTAHDLVNWICWDQTAYKEMGLTVDHYILQVGEDGPEIEVNTEEYEENGVVHYPYHVPRDLPKGANKIYLRPVGFKYTNGDNADYKVTEPFEYTHFSGGREMGAINVQDNPTWAFNSGSGFRTAMTSGDYYNGSTNTYTGYVHMFGLTIYGGNKGLKPFFDASYIQTGGTGSTSTRCFKLTVDRPGKVIVSACKSGTSDGRSLNLYYREDVRNNPNQATLNVPVTASIGSPEDYTFELPSNISGPYDLTIYSTENLNIYSIRYEPSY